MLSRNLAGQNQNRIILIGLTSITLSLAACGKTAFEVVPNSQQNAAPGTFSIPPKVDILLVEDDKGRMFEAWNQISQQMPIFLANLNQKAWDYHFATTALTTYSSVTAVTASSFDGNWGSNWTKPYPGAPQLGPGTVASSFFQLPSVYNGYLNESSVSNAQNGYEPGFQTLQKVFTQGFGNSNFLRSDALFVPLIVSLGNDTSDVNMCAAPDSTPTYTHYVPCEQINPPCNGSGGSTCGSSADSLNKYTTWFKNFKSNIQVHAAVAAQNSNSCLGSIASAGFRYQKLAAATGGLSYDICSQPISQILNSLSNQLQSQRLAYKQRYLFISQPPTVSSIVVTRNIGGNASSTQIIPQDPNHGWSYAGYVQNVYAIDYPVSMNQSSGYAIRLSDDSELSGMDTATVTYVPEGAHNSISE